MLDEQAKVAYGRRRSELREELEEAKQLGNDEYAEKTEQKIDALTRELSRAMGTFCSYRPDPNFPIAWEFAEPITEPARQSISGGEPVRARAD